MPDTPRTAAAYIRVSTDEQADQSPESQLIEIRKYAEKNRYVLPDALIFVDEGISGKRSENRPAFLRMIGAAKQDPAPFDTILLWKFSRFARNQEESIVYKALLRKQCGVDVVSVSEPLPGGPFASLIERIIEWFDEFYSIRLAQEVKRSMTVKAGRGEFQSSPAFGYRARIEPGQKTVLEPIPEEAALVQEIFRRFLAGDGFTAIAKWLNAQGAATHRGGAFENRTVEYILRNPVYIGKLRWTPTGRTRRNFSNPDTIIAAAAHEPIIRQELFDAAQAQIARVKAAWGPKARPAGELRDWLSGLVRCSECGAPLVFVKPHYFRCNNYARGRCRCSQHISADLLHKAVSSQLERDARLGSVAYRLLRSGPETLGELPRLQAKLADLHRRDARLLEAYLSGALSLEQFTGAKAGLSFSIEEVQAGIAKLASSPDEQIAAEQLHSAIRSAFQLLNAPDISPAQKNAALRTVIKRMIFNKASMTLDIRYRLPASP